MKILFFIIIIIPIVIIGELHINKTIKNIVLLLLTFLYNNLLGLATWFSMFIICYSVYFFHLFFLPTIIIGISILIFLIPINIYVKRKIDINIIVYIILNVIAFMTGLCLSWRG